MTTTVFIAGSINIKNLDSKVCNRIERIISSEHKVIVGDAKGADSSIQSCLSENSYSNTVVYCSGNRPRNNIGDWPICKVVSQHKVGTRAFFTEKDVKMAEDADFGLMIWDAKSTGTLSNVIELLKRKRKSVVFVNKIKEFKNIKSVSDLVELTECMSDHARLKADKKIGLFHKIDELNNNQLEMFK